VLQFSAARRVERNNAAASTTGGEEVAGEMLTTAFHKATSRRNKSATKRHAETSISIPTAAPSSVTMLTGAPRRYKAGSEMKITFQENAMPFRAC